MVNKYIPKIGDIVYIDLNPTKGHEQKGFRPALVVSNNIFNTLTAMVIVCPITTNIKDFPTHYILNNTKKVKGAILCEHLRSIDPISRNIKFVEKLNEEDLDNVLTLIKSFYE